MPADASNRMPTDAPGRTIEDVLEVVNDFGSASFGLTAWELLTNEEALAPIWQQAIEQRMLRATGATDLDEPTYQLTLAGRTQLSELRKRSARRRKSDRSRGTHDL